MSSKFSFDKMVHENSGSSILHPENSSSNKLKHEYVNFNILATNWRARKLSKGFIGETYKVKGKGLKFSIFFYGYQKKTKCCSKAHVEN